MKTTRPCSPAEEKLPAAGNQRNPLTSISPCSGPWGGKRLFLIPGSSSVAKGGPEGQARGCSTDPAAQAGTELGLAAQGGGRRGGTLRDRPAPSSHSSPPARGGSSKGQQATDSSRHQVTQRIQRGA